MRRRVILGGVATAALFVAGLSLSLSASGGKHNCRPAWKCGTTSTPPTTTAPPATTSPPPEAGCSKSLSGGDIKAFVASLQPGETGCVSGPYSVGTWHITNGGFALKGPASLKGVVYLEAAGTTLDGLTIDGTGIADVTLVLWASNLTARNLDVSNGTTGYSCVIVGSYGARRVSGVEILRSHLHDCGDDPQHDHGIYVDSASGTHIADNVIENVAAWGVQLYPDADSTLIEFNRISTMQRSSVIFASQYKGATSNDNHVTGNVLTNPAYWYSQTYWGGDTGSGNELASNCVSGAGRGESDGGPGVAVHDNLVSSSCPLSYGPR